MSISLGSLGVLKGELAITGVLLMTGRVDLTGVDPWRTEPAIGVDTAGKWVVIDADVNGVPELGLV